MTDVRIADALRLRRQGRLAEAARIYDDILRTEPSYFEALHGLGLVRYHAGEFVEAERLIAQAIAVQPEAAEALYNRASLLTRLGRFEEAIVSFNRAIAAKPDYLEALVNRGGAFMQLGAYAEAERSFGRALALRSNMPEIWVVRGNALMRLNRRAEAVECFDKALALKPGHVEYLSWRADLLLQLRRFEDASRDYRAILAAEPDRNYVLGSLAFSNLCLCDWLALESDKPKLAASVRAGKKVLTPFPSLILSGWIGGDLSAPARQWSREEFPAAAQPLWRGERYGHKRIRVAYLSADFNEHAVARLMAGVFEQHDRARFETFGVSIGPDDGSALRARLSCAFDRFVEARDKSNAELAGMLKEMEIDIAVDLMGHTDGCRPGVFALRPAPVQVNYLGYPGTSGADYIDYIVGDATVTPFADQAHYSERIVQLPDCYLPNDRARAISPATPSRTEAGLPQDGFVFCCFNNSYKFTPAMFDIWMRILGAVENSVLWLSQVPPAAMDRLRRAAESRGIAPSRLVRAPFAPSQADHLARQRLAGLFLDTLPYNAHATAVDALWAGLPVLTCAGDSFPGRVAASLNRAVGLPEMNVSSLAEYEARAIALAKDDAVLGRIKEKLAANRLTAPLFDTERLTRNLESAFVTMWERAERGEPPQAFAVAETAGAP